MKKEGRGFYDLSIVIQNKEHIPEVLTTLTDLGYNTVALNQVIEESAFETCKKKRKGPTIHNDPIPPPFELSNFQKQFRNRLRLLNRITVHFSDTGTANKMVSSENFKKFDIQAVVPTSMAALQHTCKCLSVDIISIDPCNKSSLKWNRKLYNKAIDHGIWFELPYANSILDASARKILINTGHYYHAVGKSKNILISSGAQNSIQVRGPYDVINMGLLLGLSEEKAKSALTHAGQSVVLQAESKRRGKALVLMELNAVAEDDSVSNEQEPQPKRICVENQIP